MILRRNQDLFNTIKALAGVNDFTDNEIADLVSFTNRRLTMAYNTSPMWERYVVASEERKVSSFTISGLSDSSNTPYNGAYSLLGKDASNDRELFTLINETTSALTPVMQKNPTTGWFLTRPAAISLNADGTVDYTGPSESARLQQASNPDGTYTDYGNPADVPKWNITGGVLGFPIIEKAQSVSYDETYFQSTQTSEGKTKKETIQDFIRIHRKKAFLNDSSTEYDFYVDVDGAHILNASDVTSAFVTYKKPIVNTTTGQVITSLDTTATSNYLTEIPLEFFNYTAHGVYADFLRMDGQHDKAAFEEQKADMFLATELERIDIINNNNSLNHKFSTYVNTSSR